MKYVLLLIKLMLFPILVFAQQLEFFGYYEPQLMAAKIENDFYQLASNKLRVDLELDASDHVFFRANFNYITYHGKTKWDILNFLPEKTVREIPNLTLLGFNINPYVLLFNDRQFLDNAFVRLSFKWADLTIGKQQLSMGTGYVWNPTDVFNQKDVVDPTYEQPGHNAIRLDIPIGSYSGITAIYAPTDDWKYSDLLVKFKTHVSPFDFSVLAIQKQWKFTDARLFDLMAMDFYQLSTKRRVFGGDFVGELFGLGVRGEFTYNNIKIDSDVIFDYQSELQNFYNQLLPTSTPPNPMEIKDEYYEIVLGMDYTFDFQTYIMCEFYRNTFADDNQENYSFNDWIHLLNAETKTITRDQIYFLVQHPLTDLIDISCSSIYSISDQSFGVIPMVSYNIFQNVDLNFFGNIYFGKEGAAYTKNLGNGGIARARVYF
ncbi:MAG TPA: hypothetical protein ENN22_15555 [bacterium]|nr:hypothetical protein [bacterium]